MNALHHFKTRPALEIEDIAVDFIENELGRHDWMKNWPIYKAKPRFLDRIAHWLAATGHDATPDDIARRIDQMLLIQPGRWR